MSLKEEILSHIKIGRRDILIQRYALQDIVSAVSYVESMNIAHDIFLWEHRKDDVINFVIDMYLEIKKKYPQKWNEDWQNDIYVTELCELVLRYEEIYNIRKELYQRLLPEPPAHVTYSFAKCYFLPPEVDTIIQDDAIDLFKRALEKELTYESAIGLSTIYEYRDDKDQQSYWETIANDAKSQNLHAAMITPDIFSKK